MAKKRTIKKHLSFEELLDHLIDKCLNAIKTGKLKVTVSDLMRLRSFRDEVSPQQPARPEVTWIDGWD